ncbi:MAG: YcbK family protein, partial [Deltaproteobacteria bacterium]|nr:YcbK family protein [Deltaproteobacteria bacterium]
MRNFFLKFLLLILWIPTTPSLAKELAHPDGLLRLYNYHLEETLEVQYEKNGKLDPIALEKLNHFFRSRDNGENLKIEVALIRLLDHLQDHFAVDTVEIISGYRRPKFNQKLKQKGHKVSSRSLHMQGKAADIHLDEIREETLRDYLLKSQTGGVGYYGPLDFVHVDIGEVRYWGEEIKRRKLIGVLNKEAPIQLTSDKNEYLPGEILNFTWTFQQGHSEENLSNIQLEQFHRGKWLPCPQERAT